MGYDLGAYMAYLIGQKYGRRVSEDEICLLAIHFYSCILEKKRSSDMKKILVVTTLKKSMTILLKQTLLKWFLDVVSTIHFVNPMDLKEDMLDEYEIFLTTEKNKFYDMGLAMYINQFPTEQDYLNIKLNLDGFENLESITALFKPKQFFLESFADKDKILKTICDSSIAYCEQESLYEQVIEREKIGSTYFSNPVLFYPHLAGDKTIHADPGLRLAGQGGGKVGSCDVCGAKLGIFGRFRYAGGYICKSCYQKASRHFSETVSQKSFQEVKELCEIDSGTAQIQDFEITGRIGNYVLLDEKNRKICILNNRMTGKKSEDRKFMRQKKLFHVKYALSRNLRKKNLSGKCVTKRMDASSH